MCYGFRRWAAAVFCLVLAAAAQGQPVVLLATNSVWRHLKGTVEPTPADMTAWRAVSFPASTWPEAKAPFWYGESGTFGGTGTELADMQNQYTTIYLRRIFNVTNPGAYESLQLDAICDDGFIAWVNGRQVAAVGPPSGEPAFNSLAGVNATEPVHFTTYELPDPGEVLVPGNNVLAVQVFNTSIGSSDIVFDAELSAVPRPSGAPAVAIVSPTPGPVTALDQITVTFSEPVQGVRAEDFLVNGASATGVEGTGTTYTFTFSRPPYGAVEVAWSTFHTIQDFEDSPRRFEIAAPGSVWGYEYIDAEGPSLAGEQPPAGAKVRSLSQVEVTFDKAVAGLEAADLTLNGVAATNVTGLGAGPYLFEFAPEGTGSAIVSFTPNHGIVSDSFEPHAFGGGSWSYQVDPQAATPALQITEFMAENFTALRDEDQDPEDWIEIHNPTSSSVDLEGWALTNDDSKPGEWVFPSVSLPAGGYLVVFASAKDRRPTGAGTRLHTNFKLNPNGGYLGLFAPELPRRTVSEVRFESQGPNYSFGRENGTGDWRYFQGGSAGAPNGTSLVREALADVHFSVPRGFFGGPFNLSLSCPTLGASIRFTTNGSPPTEVEGYLYTNSIPITANRVIRAAAFKTNALPSTVVTHTYLLNQPAARLRLPALSLVTATNNLYGRNGIMEVSPRNTSKRGAAWERPVSVEYIQPDDNGGFHVDCGLRIQGGDYVRGQYTYKSTALPFSKYSYRLYFRGEYGQGRLSYPLFPETTQRSFDTIVLRAGMNDHSNPYLTDEFVRTLARDCDQPSPAGTFVHLFLNGVYKGYYNPCERIDVDYLRAYHGGGEKWDVMAQAGEVREGDATAWNTLRTIANTRNLGDPVNYRDLSKRLDLTNFVDYLLPLIYVDNDDWPHNNWRAARERTTNGIYRLYVWDAEWACGIVNGHAPSWDTIRNQLSSTAPPWGGTDIQRIFNGLKKSPEFRLFFADRVHRHLFNGGALSDDRIRVGYLALTNRLRGVVTGFNNRIGTTWIPQRRRYVLQHLATAGLIASSNAPGFNVFGGRVPSGFGIVMTNLTGTIYYTTDGTDPRVSFTDAVDPTARTYQAALPIATDTLVRARSLFGTNWSALTEAAFQVEELVPVIAITEIMYHPSGGEAYEFVELANLGAIPVDLSGCSFSGIEFRFPAPFPPMPPGARWVFANDAQPTAFAARYPGVSVAGWFDGNLNNGGERISLLDSAGQVLASVEYDNSLPWPTAADEDGYSLELADADGDPNDPAAWNASSNALGSPGQTHAPPRISNVRFSEITPALPPTPDWIELRNDNAQAVNLSGWSLSDDGDPRKFVFPEGTLIRGADTVRVWCGNPSAGSEPNTPFALDPGGETLALYDAAGNRVDIVSFGSIPTGFSLGRLGATPAWQLTEPTPLAPNEPATLTTPDHLALNEWLANPSPGGDDWIELHNTDLTAPISLHGVYLATSNALHRIRTQIFVPAGGFVVLKADENPGPDHVGFHLTAAGDAIVLYSANGSELSRVTYRSAAEGVSTGRLPDGTGEPVAFPGTASPGASNYVEFATGPRFNEFMARHEGDAGVLSGPQGDWIELQNPAATTLDLSGVRLVVGDAADDAWLFPNGVSIPPNGYLLLDCDPARPASTNAVGKLNIGRGLPIEGGMLLLRLASGQLIDSVRYGPQLPNASAGRTPGGWALLASPTPGAANAAPVILGSPSSIRINEWLASGAGDDEWLELFNPESAAVDLGGYFLTDDPSLAGLTRKELAPLTLIPARGHLRLHTDGRPDRGPDHLAFLIDDLGETLRLYNPSRSLIDSVDFNILPARGSRGRFPDGADLQIDFPDSPSPASANWLSHDALIITEVLTHTDPPLEDGIEVQNVSAHPLHLDGWYVSNDASRLHRQALRSGVVLAPGQRHVIYEYEFNPTGSLDAFTLNSAHGDEVWLSETDGTGALTGYRAHAAFGAAANGVSFGRYRTSIGWDFPPLSRRTFGSDLPVSLAEFRQGNGLPEAYPLVGPVVVTEIFYRPLVVTDSDSTEIAEDEFIEIYNFASSPVPLFDPLASTNTWRLRGGIDFDFPAGMTLPAGGFALIVNFPPTNTTVAASFRERRHIPSSVPLWGPFRGRLANEGEEIRLERPDSPQAPPAPDAGFVPYLLVERVDYRQDRPWPALEQFADQSLQRRRDVEFANDPANWIAAPATPGGPTLPPVTDRDFDGIPNDWETAHNLNPDLASDAALDVDADGLSNLAEFVAGTDPRDASSALTLSLDLQASAGIAIRFHAIANRSYSVLERDDSALGAWHSRLEIPAESYDRELILPLGMGTNNVGFLRLVTPAMQ